MNIEQFLYGYEMKTHEQNRNNNRNRVIWLVYRTDTNTSGLWLVKQTHAWKNFMPENFLEINRYFALTSYFNMIGQSNNAFSILGFSLAGKWRVHVLIFSSIGWYNKIITNTYRNHFSRSYKNLSILDRFSMMLPCSLSWPNGNLLNPLTPKNDQHSVSPDGSK